MKRQQFSCFISFGQNADVHLSGKRRNSTIGPNCEDTCLYDGRRSTSRCIKTVVMFQQHFCLQHRDQRISLIIPENWEHCQIQWQLEVTSMHAGNREAADETNKEDPTQGILVWLQPIAVNLEDLETLVLAHSSERENSDSEGDASKVETQKRKHSVHAQLRKNQKRSILRTEVWWLENSRAQGPQRRTWISKQ